MSALLILAALPVACTAFLVVAAWLIEHADAEQGPPPTLRPFAPELDDGTGEYDDAAFAAAWDRQQAWDAHVAQMLRLVGEPTPIHDEIACEQIERAEGWR